MAGQRRAPAQQGQLPIAPVLRRQALEFTTHRPSLSPLSAQPCPIPRHDLRTCPMTPDYKRITQRTRPPHVHPDRPHAPTPTQADHLNHGHPPLSRATNDVVEGPDPPERPLVK